MPTAFLSVVGRENFWPTKSRPKAAFLRGCNCLLQGFQERVFLADEPTRGVDVGAKFAIYEVLAGLARDGLGVLMISSELPEVLGMAHRVLVMRNGRIVANLPRGEATEDAVMHAAFGTKEEVVA